MATFKQFAKEVLAEPVHRQIVFLDSAILPGVQDYKKKEATSLSMACCSRKLRFSSSHQLQLVLGVDLELFCLS